MKYLYNAIIYSFFYFINIILFKFFSGYVNLHFLKQAIHYTRFRSFFAGCGSPKRVHPFSKDVEICFSC